VERLSRRTDALVKEYAEGQAEAREGGKASEFRRLVAAAWPDIPQGEIDSVLTEVLRVIIDPSYMNALLLTNLQVLEAT
jgi:hypothetical protein